MHTITTTIKRRWLSEIVSGTKNIEYREIKPYWERRLAMVSVPFRLRLINGMSVDAPEVTVQIKRVVRKASLRTFELHIGRILHVKNWDRRSEQPRAKHLVALRGENMAGKRKGMVADPKRSAAGVKAALTRKRRAAGKEAAQKRKRRAAGKKAAATRMSRSSPV